MNIKLKDIPVSDRPRERLICKGVTNLSNDELLAVIIKDGTKDMNAKDVANNLLKGVNKIQELKNIQYEQLIKIKGIGIAKACTLLAAIEFGNRINTNIDNLNGLEFTSTDMVYDYFKQKIGYNTQETFYCVYLDSRNRIIKDKLLFIGTINYSMVHPREVFKEAYLVGATSIICVHNHPTGNITPSNDDIKITNLLKQVGTILGINVLDHLIIGKDKYYSFLENGNI